jgi:hypothetical protein
MTYINTTGKNIGQCLTGFAISYPLYIYNSGNSEIEYTFTNSNETNFALSQSSLILDSSSYDSVDIYYIPSRNAPSGTQSTTISITSESIEDGSTDPSGAITLQITGDKIIDITGGYVRSFKAVRNYDSKNGLNYDFYWSVPTGTENLNNYFFTGYTLDISTDSNFASSVFSKTINVSNNTNAFPVYGNFYGTDQNLNYLNVSKVDYPFIIETGYYARMYTSSVGNTGISIYATGVNSITTQLSDEVISGYSGVPKNIKFSRGPLIVYLKQGYDIQNFDLFKYIVDANYGKPDLSYFNSIEVYLPENSVFSSTDSDRYALQLDGVFENFTGQTGGDTVINIYIPETTKLLGYKGGGGQIINQNLNNFDPSIPDLQDLITKTNAAYANKTYSDSKIGGNVIKLTAETTINGQNYSDIKYKLYLQNNSSLLSGGGGSKAGIVFCKNLLGTMARIGAGTNYTFQNGNFPIQGAVNSQNTKLSIARVTSLNYGARDNKVVYEYTAFDEPGYWFSPEAGYGESGLQTIAYYTYTNAFSDLTPKTFNYLEKKIVAKNSIEGNEGLKLTAYFMPVNEISTNQICGKLFTSSSNSSILLNIYNTNLPNDYIFRFPNSAISNSPNYWSGGSSSSPSSYTLTGSASYSNNYKGFGYKTLSLKNQFLSTTFTDSVLFDDFDLYLVVAIQIDPSADFNNLANSFTFFKLLDWYSNSDSVSSKHVLYEKYPTSSYNYYLKEPNVFKLFSSILFNAKIQNTSTVDFLIYNKIVCENFAHISKSLNSSEQTYYPAIINIKRSKSIYFIFVNGVLLTTYDLLNITPAAIKTTSLLINDIKGTTFKLINDVTSINTCFFDIVCYNRLLNQNEQVNINNYLINAYFKLFTGDTSASYDMQGKDFRLPNIFNLAGTSSNV